MVTQRWLVLAFHVLWGCQLLGCRQAESDPKGAGGESITFRVQVVSYQADAAHSTQSTPDGHTYHAEMYDAAYCKVLSANSGLPDPLLIWGWNRTEYVPERLRESGATATITIARSDFEPVPFTADGSLGLAADAISNIED